MGDGERTGAAPALRNALVVTCALADAGVTAGAAEVERAALRGDRTAAAGAAAWLAGRFAATCGPPAVPAGAGPDGVMDAVLRGGPAELAAALAGALADASPAGDGLLAALAMRFTAPPGETARMRALIDAGRTAGAEEALDAFHGPAVREAERRAAARCARLYGTGG